MVMKYRIVVFVDEKTREDIPFYYSNKMYNKKVDYNKNGII